MLTRRIKIFLILFSVLLMTDCKKTVTINPKQAILFQVEYVNYAWGYQHNGFFIDNEGYILSYKNPENWNWPDKSLSLTGQQVRANLEACIKTGEKIAAEELIKNAGYIKNIALSKVTALKNVAADAGSLKYICYQYSGSSEIYTGYIIKEEGNFTCENLNFFSKKVTTWLKRIKDTLNK
jgi:hypothetical protein